MSTNAVLFDLDGTLLDSLADIATSMNLVLSERGLATHPLADYRAFVGDGVSLLVRRALPPGQRDDATAGACVARMREIYGGRAACTTRPYEGIPELLDGLEARGIRKAVLSNKPHELAVSLVATLLGRWAFDPVYGERPGVARKPDPGGALEVAARLGAAPATILYVGDTPIDIATARAAGMRALGATWGFRGEAELREAGAYALARSPVDVLAYLS